MPDEWKNLCPIDEDGFPVERQAWRGGWEYRMEHGDDLEKGEAHRIALDSIEDPSRLSAWLHGYNTADYLERSNGH